MAKRRYRKTLMSLFGHYRVLFKKSKGINGKH